MGDFPPEWESVRDLPEGGQAHTFVVRRADGSDSILYVLKRLKNPKREDYFEREIRACGTLDHPNILRVLEHGKTPKNRPYLITEYCDGGSLEEHRPVFDEPGDGLRFFQKIVAGVAQAHGHAPPICHLDLKPDNILLKDSVPVVGDFGICFIEDGEVTLTKEGPRGSIYYCAQELRDPKISGNPRPATADVYSLGKILYWLFTGDVYDGAEDAYADKAERHLAHLFPSHPQFAFVDDLISGTVRRNAGERTFTNAIDLANHVQAVLDRIEAGGRVLDLRIPQRCLYCAVGHYRPAHDLGLSQNYLGPSFPDIARRKSSPPNTYGGMQAVSRPILGSHVANGAPLFLICDYCGNVQYFRFDLTQDQRGESWRP